MRDLCAALKAMTGRRRRSLGFPLALAQGFLHGLLRQPSAQQHASVTPCRNGRRYSMAGALPSPSATALPNLILRPHTPGARAIPRHNCICLGREEHPFLHVVSLRNPVARTRAIQPPVDLRAPMTPEPARSATLVWKTVRADKRVVIFHPGPLPPPLRCHSRLHLDIGRPKPLIVSSFVLVNQ